MRARTKPGSARDAEAVEFASGGGVVMAVDFADVVAHPLVQVLHQLIDRLVLPLDEHLDAAVARATGEMDVIADLAFPLPFVVISEMLGMPEGRDRFQLREWSGAIVKTFDPVLSVDEAKTAFAASDNMFAYLQDTIAWKRANPADDVLSQLISAEDEGDRLSTDELNEQVALLFIERVGALCKSGDLLPNLSNLGFQFFTRFLSRTSHADLLA